MSRSWRILSSALMLLALTASAATAQEDAARRFQDAQGMERGGNHKGALEAYLASAEAGYGPAQRRLGEIYDRGSPATARDYQQSLRWYEKARAQGVEIPKPIQRVPH